MNDLNQLSKHYRPAEEKEITNDEFSSTSGASETPSSKSLDSPLRVVLKPGGLK